MSNYQYQVQSVHADGSASSETHTSSDAAFEAAQELWLMQCISVTITLLGGWFPDKIVKYTQEGL